MSNMFWPIRQAASHLSIGEYSPMVADGGVLKAIAGTAKRPVPSTNQQHMKYYESSQVGPTAVAATLYKCE